MTNCSGYPCDVGMITSNSAGFTGNHLDPRTISYGDVGDHWYDFDSSMSLDLSTSSPHSSAIDTSHSFIGDMRSPEHLASTIDYPELVNLAPEIRHQKRQRIGDSDVSSSDFASDLGSLLPSTQGTYSKSA